MPLYDFINTKTGKEFTDMMSIAEKEEYLKKNKHIKQGVGKINIVSGVGGLKTDSGWKDMLSRIGDAHPGSKVHDAYGNKNTKAEMFAISTKFIRDEMGKLLVNRLCRIFF